MFNIPSDPDPLEIRILLLGGTTSQRLSAHVEDLVQLDGSWVNCEIIQEPGSGNLPLSDLRRSDITIIAVCTDISIDNPSLVNDCRAAAQKSDFTVLMVPVPASSNSEKH